MVTIYENHSWDNGEKIVVNLVGVDGIEESKVGQHIDVEYRRFLRHCRKNKISLYGKVQYVPSEVWAVNMVDTMKNESIVDCRDDFYYIANLFCIREGSDIIDEKALRKGFSDILKKANDFNYEIAILYTNDGNNLKYNVFLKNVHKVFDSSALKVNVYINECYNYEV